MLPPCNSDRRRRSGGYPDAWEPYLAHIPEAERADLLSAFYRRLTSDDPAVRLAAAKIRSGWEGATSKRGPRLNPIRFGLADSSR